MPISDSDAEDTPGHGWPGSVSQHRHRTGKSAGCCCFIFTRTLPPPITFSLYHKLYYIQIFSRSLSIDSNFFSHRTSRTHSIIVRINRFHVVSFSFHFSIIRCDNSFLPSPSPFLSFYFLSFTRVLPLTPHFDSPLYTLSLVRYDNGRGRKKKDIASRRMMAITTGSLRRQTGHGTRFPDHSFLFMFSGDDRAVDRTPEQKSISTVQV